MVIHIDFKKIGNFVWRHREAVAVGTVAFMIISHQSRTIRSMEDFIMSKGL